MKKIILTWILVSSHVFLFAQLKSVHIQASGLTCSMCSNAIYKALQTITFVENVESNIEESSYKIVFKPSMKVDFEVIRKKILDAGFFVSQFKAIFQFDSLDLIKDKSLKVDRMNFRFLEYPKNFKVGENEFLIVNKNYLSEKHFKKLSILIDNELKLSSDKKNENDILAKRNEEVYYLTNQFQ